MRRPFAIIRAILTALRTAQSRVAREGRKVSRDWGCTKQADGPLDLLLKLLQQRHPRQIGLCGCEQHS